MNIKNSVVLITGANRGIGKAYVEGFLKAGAKKIYLGVRSPVGVADMVAANPDRLVPLKLDVTRPADIAAAAKKARDVNILINNAGILKPAELQNSAVLENARTEMEVNYFGPLAIIKTFAPILKANGGGALVTVSSIAGHLSFPGLPTYCASKAAVHSLIMGARIELSAQSTLVIGVYPGPIDTDMAADIDMEKFPPGQVAQATIEAIKNNQEDVFPDDFAASMYAQIRKNPKAVEAQMLGMYKEAA